MAELRGVKRNPYCEIATILGQVNVPQKLSYWKNIGGPSSTLLIRHENVAFRKLKLSSNRGNLKTLASRFSVHGKRFVNEAFRTQMKNDRVLVAFSNSSGVAWTGRLFTVKSLPWPKPWLPARCVLETAQMGS